MPQVINTNISSINAQRNLNKSQGGLSTSLKRLSSGLRINSAKERRPDQPGRFRKEVVLVFGDALPDARGLYCRLPEQRRVGMKLLEVATDRNRLSQPRSIVQFEDGNASHRILVDERNERQLSQF